MLFRLSGLSDPLDWGPGKVYGFNCYSIRCVYISVYVYIYIYIYGQFPETLLPYVLGVVFFFRRLRFQKLAA